MVVDSVARNSDFLFSDGMSQIKRSHMSMFTSLYEEWYSPRENQIHICKLISAINNARDNFLN